MWKWGIFVVGRSEEGGGGGGGVMSSELRKSSTFRWIRGRLDKHEGGSGLQLFDTLLVCRLDVEVIF